MIKPCGTIVSVSEMYTFESSSQIFSFLLHFDNFIGKNIRYIGYDRACELVPFLQGLARNGNYGARLLLDNIGFFVDAFHVKTHKAKACDITTDQCKFHPKLEKFRGA